jgi:hypothetical protein
VARRLTTRAESDRPDVRVERLFSPLIVHEIAAIAGINTAIGAETHPDYVVLYHGAKTGKQANVEQMTTVIRRRGGIPPEHGGLRKYVLQSQAAVVERVAGTTATLQAMRAGEVTLLKLYTEAIAQVEGIARTALRKALGRTLVHCHVLTAHIAKRTGATRDVNSLPQPLDRYFAGQTAKACMRCHLDRPVRCRRSNASIRIRTHTSAPDATSTSGANSHRISRRRSTDGHNMFSTPGCCSMRPVAHRC